MIRAPIWSSSATSTGAPRCGSSRNRKSWDRRSGSPGRYINPVNAQGRQARADGYWSGWLHAVDADTGVWKWRLKSNYPIVAGVTPIAGGLVFFGDVGGNFYAVDAVNGQKLWGQKIGGAIAGGVDHLQGQWRAESRGDDGFHISCLAG
jgi:outer membrane protein assembly factor BamB